MVVAWSMSLSHKWRGNLGGRLARLAMKWSLKVPMAYLTGFIQWL